MYLQQQLGSHRVAKRIRVSKGIAWVSIGLRDHHRRSYQLSRQEDLWRSTCRDLRLL